MSNVIVIEFITLDGIVEDPDGSGGTPFGGWAFRHGPEAVAGDKFRLGDQLDRGTLLLGRRTWQLFSRLWPHRSDPFSNSMNRVPKAVSSSEPLDVSLWNDSTLLDGDVTTALPRLLGRGDVIVAGSIGLVQALVAKDLVDEYRLLVFPSIVGTGRRLFAEGPPPTDVRLHSVERSGAAALMRYER